MSLLGQLSRIMDVVYGLFCLIIMYETWEHNACRAIAGTLLATRVGYLAVWKRPLFTVMCTRSDEFTASRASPVVGEISRSAAFMNDKASKSVHCVPPSLIYIYNISLK